MGGLNLGGGNFDMGDFLGTLKNVLLGGNKNMLKVSPTITDQATQKALITAASKGITPANYTSKATKTGTVFTDKMGRTYTVTAKSSTPPKVTDLVKKPSGTAPPTNTPTTKKTSGASMAAKTVSKPAVAPQSEWYYSGDEIAKKFKIDNNEASILAKLQGATNAKFNEYETQTNRAKDDSLRAMSGQYDQYLQGIRQNRANAVQTGITKGTAAASELATMIAGQQGTAQTQQTMQDYLVDIANQRGTQLSTDKVNAALNAQEIGKYLAGIGAQYEGNDVNRQSAKLNADATVQAARLSASGMTSAAGAAGNAQIELQEWLRKAMGENEWKRAMSSQYPNPIK